MTKPKTLEQLRAEKERAETQLLQEQHKLERLENRKKYLEKGERTKRTHRLCNLAEPNGDFAIATERADISFVRLSLVDLPSANSMKCCSPPASLEKQIPKIRPLTGRTMRKVDGLFLSPKSKIGGQSQ